MSYTPYPANREINTDASGRTRVSTITTLFDGKTLNFDDPLTWQNVGTGTATFANNKVTLSVTAGQYMIRRSRRYMPYYSGKSQLIEITSDGFNSSTGLVERFGYWSSNAVAPFDSSLDGFFIENDAGNISLKAYRFGTLTINVPFTSWDNYQLLQSYDWSKFTIAVFDFLWLGGSELKVWLKTTDGFVLAHTAKWASLNADTFIGSPNQCVRYEIRSSTGAGSLRTICSAVATEGDTSSAYNSQTIYTPTAIVTNTLGTIYAIKSIKKIAAARDLSISIEHIGVANISVNDLGILLLIVNPTLSAAISYTDRQAFSEGSPTTQTVTAGTGTIIHSAPVGATGSALELDRNFRASIGMNIDNTSDEYVLCYMPTTANQSVFVTMDIKVS